MSKKWRVKLLVAMLLFIAVSTACSIDSQAAKKKKQAEGDLEIKKRNLDNLRKRRVPLDCHEKEAKK